MKWSRFSDEQIIGILKGHQTDASAANLCCTRVWGDGPAPRSDQTAIDDKILPAAHLAILGGEP